MVCQQSALPFAVMAYLFHYTSDLPTRGWSTLTGYWTKCALLVVQERLKSFVEGNFLTFLLHDHLIGDNKTGTILISVLMLQLEDLENDY